MVWGDDIIHPVMMSSPTSVWPRKTQSHSLKVVVSVGLRSPWGQGGCCSGAPWVEGLQRSVVFMRPRSPWVYGLRGFNTSMGPRVRVVSLISVCRSLPWVNSFCGAKAPLGGWSLGVRGLHGGEVRGGWWPLWVKGLQRLMLCSG